MNVIRNKTNIYNLLPRKKVTYLSTLCIMTTFQLVLMKSRDFSSFLLYSSGLNIRRQAMCMRLTHSSSS